MNSLCNLQDNATTTGSMTVHNDKEVPLLPTQYDNTPSHWLGSDNVSKIASKDHRTQVFALQNSKALEIVSLVLAYYCVWRSQNPRITLWNSKAQKMTGLDPVTCNSSIKSEPDGHRSCQNIEWELLCVFVCVCMCVCVCVCVCVRFPDLLVWSPLSKENFHLNFPILPSL